MSESGFARLHESVRYHIVNSMGWPGLRPLQAEAVAPIHQGADCILLAPQKALGAIDRVQCPETRGVSVSAAMIDPATDFLCTARCSRASTLGEHLVQKG